MYYATHFLGPRRPADSGLRGFAQTVRSAERAGLSAADEPRFLDGVDGSRLATEPRSERQASLECGEARRVDYRVQCDRNDTGRLDQGRELVHAQAIMEGVAIACQASPRSVVVLQEVDERD